jgi:hypothetical protein
LITAKLIPSNLDSNCLQRIRAAGPNNMSIKPQRQIYPLLRIQRGR